MFTFIGKNDTIYIEHLKFDKKYDYFLDQFRSDIEYINVTINKTSRAFSYGVLPAEVYTIAEKLSSLSPKHLQTTIAQTNFLDSLNINLEESTYLDYINKIVPLLKENNLYEVNGFKAGTDYTCLYKIENYIKQRALIEELKKVKVYNYYGTLRNTIHPYNESEYTSFKTQR